MLYPVELRAPFRNCAPRRLAASPGAAGGGESYPIKGVRCIPGVGGRGRGIRTPDILLPKQARYQTALYPGS